MSTYIHQKPSWPQFIWNDTSLLTLLSSTRYLQGRLLGKMELLGFQLKSEANLEVLTQDIVKSNEIEGEILNPEQVRSSLARSLGSSMAGLVPSEKNIDGVVEVLLDATQNSESSLDKARLCLWHSKMFPEASSNGYKILTGQWRDDSTGPMQVVSGPIGREKVHFEAPAASRIESEMKSFLDWYNLEKAIDPILKAGIAHFGVITIHPFEDGNGRIARAITDMLLARADQSPQRFYSMSAQIRKEREAYYRILESSQKGSLDITEWLVWFLECLSRALIFAEDINAKVLRKYKFWNTFRDTDFNERQRNMINRLLGDFKGKLTTSKWAKITKSSQDTALRDIQALLQKGVLQREDSGRNTNYTLVSLS